MTQYYSIFSQVWLALSLGHLFSYIWLDLQKPTKLSQQQKPSLMFNIVATFSHCPDIAINYEAIDGQVCFHRWSFANPVKPRWSTTESMGPLMGTNKAAWGVKLLVMTVWSNQVDCGSFCALLKTQHCCLPPCGWYCLPSASHPPPTPSHSPTPINFIHDIAGVVKTTTKTSSPT